MIFFFSGWTSNRDNSLPCFILPQLHDIGSPERLQTGQLSSIELGGDSKPQLVFYPFIYLEHPVLYFQMLEYAVFVYSYICIYQSILRYFRCKSISITDLLPHILLIYFTSSLNGCPAGKFLIFSFLISHTYKHSLLLILIFLGNTS